MAKKLHRIGDAGHKDRHSIPSAGGNPARKVALTTHVLLHKMRELANRNVM
jgi:hypothetical protein